MIVLLNPIPTSFPEFRAILLCSFPSETTRNGMKPALGMMDSIMTFQDGTDIQTHTLFTRFLALRNMLNDSIRERLLRRRNKY